MARPTGSCPPGRKPLLSDRETALGRRSFRPSPCRGRHPSSPRRRGGSNIHSYFWPMWLKYSFPLVAQILVPTWLKYSLTFTEQSKIHESRCKVDKFELVITGEDGANGDLSMVAYGKDMNIVRRELKVHISHLCYILCTAAEDYYKNNKEKFDFIKYSIEDDRPKTFL